jgi:hypothetical protein
VNVALKVEIFRNSSDTMMNLITQHIQMRLVFIPLPFSSWAMVR